MESLFTYCALNFKIYPLLKTLKDFDYLIFLIIHHIIHCACHFEIYAQQDILLFTDDVTSSSLSQDETTVIQTAVTVSEQPRSDSEQSQSAFLPDLLQLGQQKQVQQEECTAAAVEQPQTISASSSDVILDSVTVATAVDDQERKESRGSCDSYMSQSSIGPRSMSSPDFLLQV